MISYYRIFLYFIEEIIIDKMKDILRIQKASSKIDIMKFSIYYRFLFFVPCLMNSFLFILLFAFCFSSLLSFLSLYIQFFPLLFHPIKTEQNTHETISLSLLLLVNILLSIISNINNKKNKIIFYHYYRSDNINQIMTSSNKARRYLQHHKQYSTESNNSPQSSAQLLIVEPTLSTTAMRKFRGKTHQVSIPQICVHNNDNENNTNNNNNDDDDDNGHVAVLNQFDQVLDNELKRTSVLRTTSLKQNELIEYIGIPINQQRSFSFALGSKTNIDGEKHDDDDELMDILPSKTMKLPTTSKSSISKERFSRLFHSLTFRSGSHTASKISVKRIDSQSQQQSCLACQNYPNPDLISKNRKRPSIFGVLVSKFNTVTTSENIFNRCSVCKRPLSKSISNNDDNQQLPSSKIFRDQKQLFLHIKRRQSLPSLFHNLLESSSSSSVQHRPSISTVLNQHLNDNIDPELSQSTASLTESDDNTEQQRINYDDPSQLIEKVSLSTSGTHTCIDRRSSINIIDLKEKKKTRRFIIV